MEIISRQQAIARRLSTYFTGQPCKNGHIAKRYLQSATCAECLRMPRPSTPQPPQSRDALRNSWFAEQQAKAARRKARALMEPKRFRIYPGDLELFQAAAHVIAAAREPKLQLSDVLTKRKPELYANLALHTLMVHPDDLPALRALESNLERNHA